MNQRRRLRLRGAVQGVGFRPFVYRLAHELALAGFVTNDPGGVTIEVEGPSERLDALERRVVTEAPRAAHPELTSVTNVAPLNETAFEIRESEQGGTRTAVLLPDIATCADCAREVADPADRRHGYPFTNCTNCGPRFSIIRELPYDRPHTTMSGFAMCARCEREYHDPLDRRFHAQPNACPDCGPTLAWVTPRGDVVARRATALDLAVAAVREGRVVALKGLGGFHLVVDAANAEAVRTLRERKNRWEKPLAVMAPSIEAAARLVELTPPAVEVLTAPEAPIVLLRHRSDAAVAAEVAPGNPYLGVMLPYTPLHQSLLDALDHPIVATSGNVSDEPICIDPDEARHRLAGIADGFLVHDRPIERQVDDSVVTLMGGAAVLLRRSRGHAPRPIRLRRPVPPVLAVGPHLKNTVALAIEDEVFVSQHVGDLTTELAVEAHDRVVRDFLAMYGARPAAVAHDLHPDYHSTHFARDSGLGPLVAVQHHHAHLAACLAEHGAEGPALGVTWDGTGYGADATIWGGEFLLGDAASYERVAHLVPFRLPGGDAAVKEPRRVALALLAEAGLLERAGDNPAVRAFTPTERRVAERMLTEGLNSPVTTSAGRLFDGIAALVGLRQRVGFEGQAAMMLEWEALTRDEGEAPPYPLPILDGPPMLLDHRPLVEAVVSEVRGSAPSSRISRRFHETLAHAIVAVAQRVGQSRVVLSGGCFQNRLLTERARTLLENAGFSVLLHRKVPPNDGAVSLGQVAVAAATLLR